MRTARTSPAYVRLQRLLCWPIHTTINLSQYQVKHAEYYDAVFGGHTNAMAWYCLANFLYNAVTLLIPVLLWRHSGGEKCAAGSVARASSQGHFKRCQSCKQNNDIKFLV